jgi:hypothetical protein
MASLSVCVCLSVRLSAFVVCLFGLFVVIIIPIGLRRGESRCLLSSVIGGPSFLLCGGWLGCFCWIEVDGASVVCLCAVAYMIINWICFLS